jgi:signal transduction histidine kinase
MPGWSLDSPLRLHALAEVDVFPGAPSPAFLVYTRLVARLLEVPTALVSFVGEDCQFFPAATGLAEPWATRRQTPLALSFCQHVVTGDADLIVNDAQNDARVQDNPAVGELGVRAYLGVPLRAPGGETLGSLCAIDHHPREWSERDIETMHDIAEAAASTIALRVSEHRRAAVASEVSHELRTPLTRLRFELDDLARSAGVDAAVAHVQDLTSAIEELTRAARRDRVRDVDVDLLTLCHDVASQREAGSPIRIEGAETVVRSLPAILHHVVALLVGAFDGEPLVIAVGGDEVTGRIQLRADAEPADIKAIVATRRLLLEQLAGRLIERPAPGVAFEVVLPR